MIKGGPTTNGMCSIEANGQLTLRARNLEINGYEGNCEIYSNGKTGEPYIGCYSAYVSVGRPDIEAYIDGSTVYINGSAKGITLSEYEVHIMELEYDNQQNGLRQSELEVTLMERGIL